MNTPDWPATKEEAEAYPVFVHRSQGVDPEEALQWVLIGTLIELGAECKKQRERADEAENMLEIRTKAHNTDALAFARENAGLADALAISNAARQAAEACAHQCKEEAWALQAALELLKAPQEKDGKTLKPWERVEALVATARKNGSEHAAQRIIDVLMADAGGTPHKLRGELRALTVELRSLP